MLPQTALTAGVSRQGRALVAERPANDFGREAESHEKTGIRFVGDVNRVLFGDGWGLLRASNTQPVLVLRFEANSEDELAALRSEVEGTVARLRD